MCISSDYPLTITARDLLSEESGRRLVLDLLRSGKKHTAALDQVCSRAVQQEALALLSARIDRRAARAVAQAARRPVPQHIEALREQIRRRHAEAAAAKKARANARLLAGRIGREALEKMLPSLLEQVSHEADAAVRAAVSAVGRIGDQAADDLSRMRTGEDFSGKKGRHHKLERTSLCRVEHLADWSACLLTLRDYVSFGSSRWGNGDRNYGSRGGSSFRVFLVVRDSTTGEAHILRVPPKFGNSDTQFFGKFSNARERIQAAVAWTFSREAGEYAPTHQA
jgi:hypothetical protein